MRSREEVINIVQKLLTRTSGNNCTDAEVEVAMSKVQELMLEYGLDQRDLEVSGNTSEWIESEIWRGRGRTWEVPFVLEILEDFFFVKSFYRGSHRYSNQAVAIFGEKGNVEFATQVYKYLCSAFRDLWTSYRLKRGLTQAHSRGYFAGLKNGFSQKLRDERGLLCKKRQDIKDNLPILKSQLEEAYEGFCKSVGMKILGPAAPINVTAYRDGFQAGKTLNLNIENSLDKSEQRALGGKK